ncbi:MAG: 3',5'-cyclic-AMP phosphodiesterase [Pseudohongiellaceae bacterium]
MISLTTQDPIRLVQITDTHLYGSATGTLLKMNTGETFDSVLDLVDKQEEEIDLILATGDIAQDATVTAYRQFIEGMARFDAPFRWIPGNHDSASLMIEVGGKASGKEVRINNWQILFLDSSVEGQVHGRLTPVELQFLEAGLEAAAQDASVAHCLICLHHNPVKGSAAWMQDIGLQNGDEFFTVVGRFAKCRCVVYGHIHQELDFEHRGVRCLCTPSTCIQFKPDVINFALDRRNPGYRTLELFGNGDIQTQVSRITGFASAADFRSTGY